MNNTLLKIMNKGIVALLFLSLINCSYSQDKRVPVEPSEERLNSQHKPEQLMEVIGVEEGMVVAEIGAGRGRMTVFFAVSVGEKGKVLANDIDKSALGYLENRCKRNNINNVSTFLGSVDNPMLPEGIADILFMVSTYHHLERPVELMRNAISCLKPDGRLVIVERDPSKTGQSSYESTSQAKLTGQMTEAGYELIRIDTKFLESDNIYFFTVKALF